MRPAEVDVLLGDAEQGAKQCWAGARRQGWRTWIAEMVEADLARHRARMGATPTSVQIRNAAG